jgi:hypothetical protein
MIHCADGVLRNEEKISDVRDDIPLMLDKPLIYLHLQDQDMGRLSTFGLQMLYYLYYVWRKHRRRHYQRGLPSVLAIKSGFSGCGKSFLADEYGKYVLSSGEFFYVESSTNFNFNFNKANHSVHWHQRLMFFCGNL